MHKFKIALYFEYSIYWANIPFILSNFKIKFSQIYNINWANINFTFLSLKVEVLTIEIKSLCTRLLNQFHTPSNSLSIYRV